MIHVSALGLSPMKNKKKFCINELFRDHLKLCIGYYFRFNLKKIVIAMALRGLIEKQML